MPGEAERDGNDIIADGEGEDVADRAATHDSGVKDLRRAAEKVKVRNALGAGNRRNCMVTKEKNRI